MATSIVTINYGAYRYIELGIVSLLYRFFIAFLLPGNKKDLEEIREVPFSSAQSLAAHYGMLDVLETSAKENVNIEDAFVKLAEV